jgi:hypothetical protein
VIEDIVELESLDHAVAATETRTSSSDAFPPSAAFDLSEPPIEAASGAEEREATTWDVAEPAIPVQAEQSGPDQGSDDLNTNTLAELYISQGFYDKAIEIYQGMLNDRPGNAALQQKLEQIRAMAGASDKGQELFTAAASGPGEYTPPAAEVIPETPTTAPEKTPSPADASSRKEAEPREPAPQMTVQDTSGEHTSPRGPQTAMTRRKETIERLESWLNTIMKEKQE